MTYFIIVMVSLCGIWDFKKRKIPNFITLPLLSICIIYQGYRGNILIAVVGLGIAFLLGMVCFLLKGMGGGDVKLMAVIGTYFGTYSFLHILFIASLLVMCWWVIITIRLKIKHKYENKQKITVPFGTCLSMALIYIQFI